MLVGEPRAQAPGLFQICRVPLVRKPQEKALHGFISHAVTSGLSDTGCGVPSSTDLAEHEAGPAEAGGLPSCPQVRAFVRRAQVSHCSLFFLVCVPNTQCPPFSGTKENRRWHEKGVHIFLNELNSPTRNSSAKLSAANKRLVLQSGLLKPSDFSISLKPWERLLSYSSLISTFRGQFPM